MRFAKIIRIQYTINIDKPFTFKMILKNDIGDEMKLTIDKNVQKSLFFMFHFYCENEMLRSDVANPKGQDHDYEVYYLKKMIR